MTKWQENKNARIGIMGGAFNPFHNGHLRHAIEVLENMPLDHIEILPSAHHPHKKGLLPFELRLEYIHSAIKDIPFLSINTMENELPAPSYTEKVLRAWREKNPLHKPYFLLGAEDFSVLNTWHKGLELPSLAHLLIVSRYGNDAKLACDYAQKYWREIYISREGTSNTSIHKKYLSDSIDNDSIDNDFIGDDFIYNDAQIPNHYEKFTHESHVKNAEQLQIFIPNKGLCTYLHIPHLDISATKIRKLWAQQKCLKGLVSESVRNLMEQHTSTLKKYW